MFDKETLSRVPEFKAGTKIVGAAPVQPVAAPLAGSTAQRADDAQQKAARAMDTDAFEKALGNLSAHVQNLQRSLQFSVDKGSGETVVRVIDTETKELIRQIPSEELLVIAARLRETAGVLLQEHA